VVPAQTVPSDQNAPPDQTTPSDQTAQARQLVDWLNAEKFTQVETKFDPALADSLGSDKLRDAWKDLLDQAGNFRRQLGTQRERVRDYEIIIVTCAFEKTTIKVKVVFNPLGQVTGLWFLGGATAQAAPAAYQPPAYVQPESFQEKPVQLGTAPWRLAGSICLPAAPGPFPAVVLVHDMGSHDRDETIGPNLPFRDLAWGLASAGIAVLRYDKRTFTYPDAVASTKGFTVKQEVVDDVLAAVKFLTLEQKINPNRVFILGHGLGGMLVPAILKADPNLAGGIILAGPVRRLEDILLTRTNFLLGRETVGSEKELYLEQLRNQLLVVKDPNLALDYPSADLPLSLPASYWLDLRGYNPLEVAQKLPRPLLILQGGRDFEVTLEDFREWKKGLSLHSGVTYELFLSLNHYFLPGPKGERGAPAEYELPAHVAPGVITSIVKWLQSM
jgi:uncharacterized protein